MGLEEIEVAAILIWIITKSKNVRKKMRNAWSMNKPWLEQRDILRVCNTLLFELRLEEEKEIKNNLRMNPGFFHELFKLVTDDFTKKRKQICEMESHQY